MRRLHRFKFHLKKSSPTILCCVASVGVIGTAITAARATVKAQKLADKAKRDYLSKEETIIMVAPVYIPTVAIGIGTIFCIFGANALNKRQQATLLSAYTLAEQSFKDYKAKVKELYGEDVHNTVMDAIIKEKCEDVHITSSGFFNSTLDPDLKDNPEIVRTFYDQYSQRFFESTLSQVIQAEYHLNRNYVIGGAISLNEFYEYLGLEKDPTRDVLGWNCCDEIYWIDFDHRTVQLDDGLEIISIEMPFEPHSYYTDEFYD